MKSGPRQLGQKMSPGIRRIRETVQAEGQRPAPSLEQAEFDPIRLDMPLPHGD
jgi:hypothetical protein